MTNASEHEIRQRAYEIWLASGMNEGDAERHWLHAESAVRNEMEAAASSSAAVQKKATATKGAGAKGAKAKVAKANPSVVKAAASRRPRASAAEAVA